MSVDAESPGAEYERSLTDTRLEDVRVKDERAFGVLGSVGE